MRMFDRIVEYVYARRARRHENMLCREERRETDHHREMVAIRSAELSDERNVSTQTGSRAAGGGTDPDVSAPGTGPVIDASPDSQAS